MINFLPPIQKKELENEEKLKIISILGMIFFFSLLSLCLILFSIKVILAGQLEFQKIIFELREKELAVLEIEKMEKEIKKYNSIFSNLLSFYQNQTFFVEILEKFSKSLPEGVYLKNINLKKLEKEIELSTSGFSPDRETLSRLRENLGKEKEFSGIEIPTQSWLSPEDFSLKLKIKK